MNSYKAHTAEWSAASSGLGLLFCSDGDIGRFGEDTSASGQQRGFVQLIVVHDGVNRRTNRRPREPRLQGYFTTAPSQICRDTQKVWLLYWLTKFKENLGGVRFLCRARSQV